jgi:hypothetical protein
MSKEGQIKKRWKQAGPFKETDPEFYILAEIIDEAKQNFPEYDGSAEDFYVKVMGWKEEYLGK